MKPISISTWKENLRNPRYKKYLKCFFVLCPASTDFIHGFEVCWIKFERFCHRRRKLTSKVLRHASHFGSHRPFLIWKEIEKSSRTQILENLHGDYERASIAIVQPWEGLVLSLAETDGFADSLLITKDGPRRRSGSLRQSPVGFSGILIVP